MTKGKAKQAATSIPSPTIGIKKSGKRRSDVWGHFTENPDGKTSKCNYCGSVLKSETSKSGTSSLRRHVSTCPAYKALQFDEKQKTLKVDRGESGGLSLRATVFDQDECRRSLVRMIILDELPFSIVDGEGFRDFVKRCCPRFEIPSRWTIARDVFCLYNETKKSLKNKIIGNKQRICITTDCWTSIQNNNYMVITAHFIDNKWKLHKRILSFSQVPDHKGVTIGKAIENCLLDWGIERVTTITVDNASANDCAVLYVKDELKKRPEGLILGGEYLHVRCSAHIINLIVNEGFKEHNRSVSAIRNAVKYCRSSPSRFLKFKLAVEKEQITCKKLTCLDVPTRWNSTYLMLDSALNFEKAFTRMESHDGFYYKYFVEKENEKARDGPPDKNDWDVAKKLIKYLKVFYDVTLKFSSSLKVSSSLFFKEVCQIEDVLEKTGKKSDIVLSNIALSMKLKFEKYWGSVDKMNNMLILATVLDPRYKLEYVTFCVGLLYDPNRVKALKERIENLMTKLYNEYKGRFCAKDRSGATSSNAVVNVSEVAIDDDDDMVNFNRFDEEFEKMKSESNLNLSAKNEIQKYLTERTEPRVDAFDVLYWWKINSERFEILSEIARDVLAIPVSTVASESAFSTGGRVLDPFRSSLTPKTVEALICTQNWIREDSRLLRVVPENEICIEEEDLEKIEREFSALWTDKNGNNALVDLDVDD